MSGFVKDPTLGNYDPHLLGLGPAWGWRMVPRAGGGSDACNIESIGFPWI